MRQLRLVGVAGDGSSLLLETPTGEAFRLPLDERVRAACRGDLARLGQIEIELDNPLRPREIQARVRAGESAEEVAASAGMPLDRVLRFAYPVLQERHRVVAQARAARPHPKRPATLAELVDERLVGRGTDAATLRWDAWRREDGRWTVRLSWRHTAEHSATWTFQLASRTLQPEDPAAQQLSAEEFHARTITAVTPLAMAARVSGRSRPAGAAPGAVPPPGADRPARGVEARAGSVRTGTDPGTERAAGTPASHRPADARARRSDRAAPDGASPAGAGDARRAAGRSGAAEAAPAGTDQAGTDQAGTSQAGQATADRSGAAETASTGPGAARAPAGRATGTEGAVGRAAGGAGRPGGADPAGRARPSAGSGGSGAGADLDADRGRRAAVPAWDDILLGVRRRH